MQNERVLLDPAELVGCHAPDFDGELIVLAALRLDDLNGKAALDQLVRRRQTRDAGAEDRDDRTDRLSFPAAIAHARPGRKGAAWSGDRLRSGRRSGLDRTHRGTSEEGRDVEARKVVSSCGWDGHRMTPRT